MLIVVVTLQSLSQSLEQSVITALPPTPHGDQIIKETEIAPRHLKPSSNHLVFPTQTGRLPHPSTVNDAVCYDYVMSRYAYELWHM
jgi:hypothetical protein